MYQVVCTDIFSKPHDVPADQMSLSSAAYGIYITANTVLLIQDKASGFWQFPGGFFDKLEKPFDGIRKGVELETGVLVGKEGKLVHIMEEDFFDIYANRGAHITRMFYLIDSVEGGTLKTDGNGAEVATAQYIPLDQANHFSDKEMKKYYREILKQAQEIQ